MAMYTEERVCRNVENMVVQCSYCGKAQTEYERQNGCSCGRVFMGGGGGADASTIIAGGKNPQNDPKSSYYDAGGIETMRIIEAKLTGADLSPIQGYLLGNILKYSCRLPWKGEVVRDAEKLVNYSAMLRNTWEEVE